MTCQAHAHLPQVPKETDLRFSSASGRSASINGTRPSAEGLQAADPASNPIQSSLTTVAVMQSVYALTTSAHEHVLMVKDASKAPAKDQAGTADAGGFCQSHTPLPLADPPKELQVQVPSYSVDKATARGAKASAATTDAETTDAAAVTSKDTQNQLHITMAKSATASPCDPEPRDTTAAAAAAAWAAEAEADGVGNDMPAAAATMTGPAAAVMPEGLANTGHDTPRQSQIPSHPQTLNDLLPLLTSDKRTSSNNNDFLMDLYQQYMRQGSGSFVKHPSLNCAISFRQDSLISGLGSGSALGGGLGRLSSGFGSGSGFKLSPKALMHQVSGFGDALGTCKGLARIESLGSQGTAGFSPSLGAILSEQGAGGFLRPADPVDWAAWPPMGTAEAPHGVNKDNDDADHHNQQQQQQQQLRLDLAPSMNSWLQYSIMPASGAVNHVHLIAPDPQQQKQLPQDAYAFHPPLPGSSNTLHLQQLQPGSLTSTTAAAYTPHNSQSGMFTQAADGAGQRFPTPRLEMLGANAAGHMKAAGAAAAAGNAVETGGALHIPVDMINGSAAPGFNSSTRGLAASGPDWAYPQLQSGVGGHGNAALVGRRAAQAAARRHRKQVLAVLRARKLQTAQARQHRTLLPHHHSSPRHGSAAGVIVNSTAELPGAHLRHPGGLLANHTGQRKPYNKDEALRKLRVKRQQEREEALAEEEDRQAAAAVAAAAAVTHHLMPGWGPGRPTPAAAAAAAIAAVELKGHQTNRQQQQLLLGGGNESTSDDSDDDSSDSSDGLADDLAAMHMPEAAAAAAATLTMSTTSQGHQVVRRTSKAGYLQHQQQQPFGFSAPSLSYQPGRIFNDGSGFRRQDAFGRNNPATTAAAGVGGTAGGVDGPPHFVPVAATGRHGSGASDCSAQIQQHWTSAAAAAAAGNRSGSSSAQGSPNQPPSYVPQAGSAMISNPAQQQQQQQYIATDSYSRVVVDPHSFAVTVVPRTKRQRWMNPAQLQFQNPNIPGVRCPAGVPIQATGPAPHLLMQQQQQGQQQFMPASQPGTVLSTIHSQAIPANNNTCMRHLEGHPSSSSAAAAAPAVRKQFNDGQGVRSDRGQQEHQQSQQLDRNNSLALDRPRRQVKRTAAAAAMYEATTVAAASDGEDDGDHGSPQSRKASSGKGRGRVLAAAAAASPGKSNRRSRTVARDQGSGEDSGDDSEINSGSEYESEDLDSELEFLQEEFGMGSRRRSKKKAAKGKRSGPSKPQPGKRKSAAKASSKQSPDSSPNSVGPDSSSKPVIEDTRSQFRGVTRHRRSGRWEAHIWVREMGRQVYLGGYQLEEAAAEAYDMAALKCKGPGCATNFPTSRYTDLLDSLSSMTLEELIMAVRRQSQGFSRGSSNYRGVTAHPSGRWESRIGIPGSRHVYLGLFGEEQEAARAYDRALVRLKGLAAATNFSLACYQTQLAENYQMKMAVDEGLVPKELFKKHSGADFEQWIKQGISAFGIRVTQTAKDMAIADTGADAATGTAAGGSTASPVLLRLSSLKSG